MPLRGGGVKIVEIGRLENRSIRGMIPALADVCLGAVPKEQWRKKWLCSLVPSAVGV
jgi:hypothetical protein